jgi:hypothetical protein
MPNAACSEIVAIGGRTHHSEVFGWEERDWCREFEPTLMYPAPPLFPIPKTCPEVVATHLKKAFALVWRDAGSSANRLRAAAEALLTEKKVPRMVANNNGKKERLSLHARIERFKQADAHSAEYLLAIKWIGNVGSHSNLDELLSTDLLDGLSCSSTSWNVSTCSARIV